MGELPAASSHKRKRGFRVVPNHEEYHTLSLKQNRGERPACRMKHVTFLQTVSQPSVGTTWLHSPSSFIRRVYIRSQWEASGATCHLTLAQASHRRKRGVHDVSCG